MKMCLAAAILNGALAIAYVITGNAPWFAIGCAFVCGLNVAAICIELVDRA